MISESCDGGSGELEGTIVLGFLEKEYLSEAIVKPSNNNDFLIDFHDWYEGSKLLIIDASSHRLDTISNFLLL